MATIRLSEETEKRLNYLAKATGRTKSYYLRELIELGLEDMEDLYLGQQVRERIRKGQEKTISAAAMRKHLGLDD